MANFDHDKIDALLFPHGQYVHRVGENGVTAIEEEAVYGQMAMVPWFRVQKGDNSVVMVNAAHVETVEYAAAPRNSDDEPF